MRFQPLKRALDGEMKYGMVQFIIKCIVTVLILWGLFIFWKKDIDIKRLFNFKKIITKTVEKPTSWVPTREQDSIYQNDKIVGKIIGEKISVKERILSFEEIFQSNELDTNQEFEFRKWRVKIKHIETMTNMSSSAPQKGRIMEKVDCVITGTR